MASSVSVLTGFDCTGSIETHCPCDEHFWLESACVVERSNDVTEAILVFLNSNMVAMLVFRAILVGVELFSYVNTFFCSNEFYIDAGYVSENVLLVVTTHNLQLTLMFFD